MNKQEDIIDIMPGLELVEPDPRDYSLSGVFGAFDISQIPNGDWLNGSIYIKDQGATDMCTGFGLSAVREDSEEVELSPEWLFAQIKKMRGDPQAWGGDLNSGCKVAVKLGAVEKSKTDLSLEIRERNYLAYAKNWPQELLPQAKEHIAKSFFRIDGPYDTFDNIRSALWANRVPVASVYTGCTWRPGWTQSPNGVLPTYPIAGGVGHCFKICNGQRMIGGKPHLIIQNSAGKDKGQGGLFYMSREVANRELKFGAYMFIDMPKEYAQKLNGEFINWKNKSFFEKVIDAFKELFLK